MKRSYRLMIAVLLAAAMSTAYLRMGIFFETNDDRAIAEVLSGTITRISDAHLQLVNYLLSAPLAWLYRITQGIPWYGACLILFHAVSYTVIFDSILSCCIQKYEKFFGMGLCGVIFLLNLYSIGFIQWTSTAALLAIAGYACLILQFDDRAVLICAGLQFFSFLLRSDAMLMIQPLGGAVLLGSFFGQGGWRKKEQSRIIFRWIFAIGIILVIGILSQQIVYRSDEWKAVNAYSTARAELMDYYGVPPYDVVQVILDKYHVTPTEYEGFANDITVGSDISVECLEELVTYAKGRAHIDLDLGNLILSSVEKLLEASLSCNRVAALLWVCILFWMILARRKDLIIPVLGLGAARAVIWCYLIYRGRMPNRVTYPLFFAETVLLLSLILKSYAGMDVKTYLHKAALLCVCGIVAWGVQYRSGPV